MGILAILFALTSFNLVTPQRRTSLGETITLLTSDLRTQQLKAMLGDTAGTSPETYGIYFANDRYVLFKGSSYSAADPANFAINLTPGFIFSTVEFPGSVIIFSRGSGEAGNFVAAAYNLDLTDAQNGQTTVITVNRYGTITQVN
jgi:hypothetical protein